MTNRLSIIALFVLATLLATGGVELFCRFLDQTLIIAPQPSVAKTSGPARTYSGAKSATPGIASVTGAAGKDYSIIIKRSLFGKPPKKRQTKSLLHQPLSWKRPPWISFFLEPSVAALTISVPSSRIKEKKRRTSITKVMP